MAEPEPTASKPPAAPVPVPSAPQPPAGATTAGASTAGATTADAEADAPVLHSTRLPAATGPSPRTPADDDDAHGDELRDALAELRTSLDVDSTGPGRRGTRLLRRRPQAGDGQGPTLSEAPPAPPVDEPAETRAEPAQRAEPVAEPAETRAEPAQRAEPVDEPLRPVDPGDPLQPTPRRLVRRRSAGVAAAVTALVIVVALAVTRGPLTRQEGAATAPSASPVATGGGPTATASGALPTPAAPPPLATRPLPWPGGPVLVPAGLPVAGPGADAPGTELTAAVDPDRQHVDAYERVVLRPGDTSVLLAAPSAAGLPAELRQVRPVVEDLQAEVDGRPVAPVAEGRGWRVRNPDGGGVGQLVLRYRLRGALARQEPAPPGRANLLLRPLTGDVSLGTGDPVVVRIDDRRVGSLYCPAPRPALCGADAGAVHTATVPAGATPVVLAQVTL